MASNTSPKVAKNASEACEIIELAIGDLEMLTRAFQVIQDVCEERNSEEISLSMDTAKYVVN
jgi:hypothetical protein